MSLKCTYFVDFNLILKTEVPYEQASPSQPTYAYTSNHLHPATAPTYNYYTDQYPNQAEIEKQIAEAEKKAAEVEKQYGKDGKKYEKYWKIPDSDEFDDDDEDNKKKKKDLIIGLSVGFGCLALLILVALIIYCKFYRRKQRHASHITFYNKNLPKSRQENDYCPTDPIYIKKIQDKSWTIDRSLVTVDFSQKLGAGAFCNVYKGRVIGEAPIVKMNPSVLAVSKFKDCDCAVKVLPEFADDIARSDFAQEINFMKTLHYHAHLVCMIGYVDDAKSGMLLVEYCKQGDLLHLLRSKSDEIVKGYENDSSLKIRDLVSFSWQISNGLEYLSSLGCIHRDIAARNVLVDESNVAKISDFGLCRLTNCLLYTGRGGRLPLKWMAPESLESFEYTEKSDVWSYGILLYEIFSFGEVPYSMLEPHELLGYLKAGNRLSKPQCCPEEIYDLMMKCWKPNPSDRPAFAEICDILIKIIENSTPAYGYIAAVNEYHDATQQQKDVDELPDK